MLAEEAYAARLLPRIRVYEERGQWRFLGVLDAAQMAAFYPNLDVITVPSLNSTESFGLVQVEAMLAGVPSVASDLPGVRQTVLQTGMERSHRSATQTVRGRLSSRSSTTARRTYSLDTKSRSASPSNARPWTTKCSSSNCWSANGADTQRG